MGHHPVFVAPSRETECAYIAGLLDGDGHIGILSTTSAGSWKYSHSLFVCIVSVEMSIMRWLQQTTGTGSITGRERPEGWRPELRWQVNGLNAEKLLLVVRPYLVIKAEQADLALEFRALGDLHAGGRTRLTQELVEQREACKVKMHALNKRGDQREVHDSCTDLDM